MRAQPGAVLIQPAPQGGPFADQSLVSHIHRALAHGDQAGLGQHPQDSLDPRGILVGGDQLGQRRAAAGVLGILLQLGQAQKDAAGDGLLLGGELLAIDRLGGLGDGPAHPARLGIALQGHHPPAAALPGLQQRVGEQRQRPRLIAHVAQDELHQAPLEAPSAPPGGFLDGPAQLVGAHRPDVRLVPFERLAQGNVLRAGGVESRRAGRSPRQHPARLPATALSSVCTKAWRSASSRQRVKSSSNWSTTNRRCGAPRRLRVWRTARFRLCTSRGQVRQQGARRRHRAQVAGEAGGQRLQRVRGGGDDLQRPMGATSGGQRAIGQRLAALQRGEQPGAQQRGFAAAGGRRPPPAAGIHPPLWRGEGARSRPTRRAVSSSRPKNSSASASIEVLQALEGRLAGGRRLVEGDGKARPR